MVKCECGEGMLKPRPETLEDLLDWLYPRIVEIGKELADKELDDVNRPVCLGEHYAYMDVLAYVTGIEDFMNTGRRRIRGRIEIYPLSVVGRE